MNNGWRVIGAAHKKRGAGLDHVDEFRLADISDVEAVETLARDIDPDLIYSVGSDLGVETSTAVSSRLGLPRFIRPETVNLIDQKPQFREFLNSQDISPVEFSPIEKPKELDGWDTYPAVLKPADSYGQRGVTLVETEAEARQHLPTALDYSRNGRALIEAQLNGFEVSVNVFLVDGVIEFVCITDRIVSQDVTFGIPMAHVLPSQRCDQHERSAVLDLVERTIVALGIQDGPLYFQIKLSSDGPKIVELAPRLDGCHLWRLIKQACDVNLLNATFNHLAGEPPKDISIEKIVPHRLEYIMGPPGAEFHPMDYEISPDRAYSEFYYEESDTVRSTNGVREKVGYYIQKAKS
jgi:phosphoribosylamine-glycine ligase